MLPPDSSDTGYWSDIALKVAHLLEDTVSAQRRATQSAHTLLRQSLPIMIFAPPDSFLQDDFASRLADMVTEAVELCDPTCLDPSALFLSNMSVPDSRLAMARLGLKVRVRGEGITSHGVRPRGSVRYHSKYLLPLPSLHRASSSSVTPAWTKRLLRTASRTISTP